MLLLFCCLVPLPNRAYAGRGMVKPGSRPFYSRFFRHCPPVARSPLLSLPKEILQLILSYVSGYDLLFLEQTDRAFHHFIQEHIHCLPKLNKDGYCYVVAWEGREVRLLTSLGQPTKIIHYTDKPYAVPIGGTARALFPVWQWKWEDKLKEVQERIEQFSSRLHIRELQLINICEQELRALGPSLPSTERLIVDGGGKFSTITFLEVVKNMQLEQLVLNTMPFICITKDFLLDEALRNLHTFSLTSKPRLVESDLDDATILALKNLITLEAMDMNTKVTKAGIRMVLDEFRTGERKLSRWNFVFAKEDERETLKQAHRDLHSCSSHCKPNNHEEQHYVHGGEDGKKPLNIIVEHQDQSNWLLGLFSGYVQQSRLDTLETRS